jgi:hypothetical protein
VKLTIQRPSPEIVKISTFEQPQEQQQVTVEEEEKIENKNEIATEAKVETKAEAHEQLYPTDLNPFGDDEESVETPQTIKSGSNSTQKQSLNPFGSCSEDENDENSNEGISKMQKPPRPPPPVNQKTLPKRISTNPFGDEDDDVENEDTSLSSYRTPVPTPRKLM